MKISNTSIVVSFSLCALFALAGALLFFSGTVYQSYRSPEELYDQVNQEINRSLESNQALASDFAERIAVAEQPALHFKTLNRSTKQVMVVINGKLAFANYQWLLPKLDLLQGTYQKYTFLDTPHRKALVSKAERTAAKQDRRVVVYVLEDILRDYPMEVYGFQSWKADFFEYVSISAKGYALLAPNGEFVCQVKAKGGFPKTSKKELLYGLLVFAFAASLGLLFLSGQLFFIGRVGQGNALLGLVGQVIFTGVFLWAMAFAQAYLPEHWLFSPKVYAHAEWLRQPLALLLLAFGLLAFVLAWQGFSKQRNKSGYAWLAMELVMFFLLFMGLEWVVNSWVIDGQYDLSLYHLPGYGKVELFMGVVLLVLSTAFLTSFSHTVRFVLASDHRNSGLLIVLLLSLGHYFAAAFLPFLVWQMSLILFLLLTASVFSLGLQQDRTLLTARNLPFAVLGFSVLLFLVHRKEAPAKLARTKPEATQKEAKAGLFEFALMEAKPKLEKRIAKDSLGPSIDSLWQNMNAKGPLYFFELRKQECPKAYAPQLALEDQYWLCPKAEKDNPLVWSLQEVSSGGEWSKLSVDALPVAVGGRYVRGAKSLWQRLPSKFADAQLEHFFYFLFLTLALQSLFLLVVWALSGELNRSFTSRLSLTILLGFLLPVLMLIGVYGFTLWQNAHQDVARSMLSEIGQQDKPYAKTEVLPGLYYDAAAGVTEQEALDRIALGDLQVLRVKQGGQLKVFLEYEWLVWQNILNSLGPIISVVSLFMLFVLLFSQYFATKLAQPILALSEKFSQTDLDQATPWYWDSEDEFGRLSKTYNAMLRRIEQSRQKLAKQEKELAWKEMARQVAHEIKNPLTPMKLSLQYMANLAKQGSLSPEALAEKLKSLENQVDTLTEIANSFSDFAKMPEPNLETFDLVGILKQTADLYEGNTEIDFALDFPEEQAMVLTDAKLMGRVVTNLVLNGIQAVPDGRKPSIHITLAKKPSVWELRVADNGSGIPEAIRDKVFVPNFSTKYSGSGIGLAIAKKAILLSRGKIWFETSEGKGTTFFIHLPIHVN